MLLVIWSQTGNPHMEYLDHVRWLCTHIDTVAIASGTMHHQMNEWCTTMFSLGVYDGPTPHLQLGRSMMSSIIWRRWDNPSSN